MSDDRATYDTTAGSRHVVIGHGTTPVTPLVTASGGAPADTQHDDAADWCDVCETNTGGGSHYHCGCCLDPKPTSMMGHGVKFDDDSFGLTCDPVNIGKTWLGGRFIVTEDRIRPAGNAKPSKVTDLVAALEESLARAKEKFAAEKAEPSGE